MGIELQNHPWIANYLKIYYDERTEFAINYNDIYGVLLVLLPDYMFNNIMLWNEVGVIERCRLHSFHMQ